jgi:hypothetical protein
MDHRTEKDKVFFPSFFPVPLSLPPYFTRDSCS